MSWKRTLTVFAIVLTLMSIIIYGCSPVQSVDPFFSLLLSHPEAPINKLHGKHYDPLRCVGVRAPVALDAKEYIYIAGSKGGKVRIVLLNQQGKVERIIIPRLKDGRFLKWCHLFSVSASGNRIWTVEWEKSGVHRVTVHDRNGRAEMDWVISGYASVELLVNAYSEHGAYVLASDAACFHFEIGQGKYRKFKIPESFRPFFPIFFHDGRYWGTGKLDWLVQRIGGLERERQIAKHESKGEWFGIATWSPQVGIRLVAELRLPRKMGIQWIDKEGNLYALHYYWIEKASDLYAIYNFPLNFLLQILEKIARTLGMPDLWKPKTKSIPILWRFSSKGEIMNKIILPAVIRPAKGEKLEYGQLVKVDETGIYLEVERVSEPKEYRIVKIVKKRRWQVWWERLVR